MPASAGVDRSQRALAIGGVALVQLGLGFVLLNGLRLDIRRPADVVERLVEISLPKPPPPARPPPPPPQPKTVVPKHTAAAPKAAPATPGAAPAPVPAARPYIPAIAGVSPGPPSGGASGTGSGAAPGSGSGGGSGGNGYGDDDGGGTDLEQIAGAIEPSDYPRNLREAGIGGRVGVLFTVGTDGRVSRCTVTRSSGVPQLDALTCRLIQQRFRYRPSTDRYGRPIPDEVEGEHDWIARG